MTAWFEEEWVPKGEIFKRAILKPNNPRELRIQRLRNQLISAKRYCCIERARLVTQSDRETEGEPNAIRRAKALDKILRGMPIYILPDELIVGGTASKPRSVEIFPDMAVYWLEEELDEIETRAQDPYFMSEEDKRELRQKIIPYWNGRTLYDYVQKQIPPETKYVRENAGVFTILIHERSGLGHVIPNYSKALRIGLNGINKEIEAELSRRDLACAEYPEVFKEVDYLNAMKICCDAAIAFAKRYADEARRLADEEDIQRKAELERIAEVCEWVPANPARTWHEALQSLWFLQAIAQIETDVHSVSLGRFDQYMYPFLKRDLDEGKITKEEAQELLECFWIKLNEPSKLTDKEFAGYTPGYIVFQNLTVGGMDQNGDDATNMLSYMVLEAQAHVHLMQPNFTVRVHKGTPNDFILRTLEVIRLGGGNPMLLNDEVVVPSLLSRGVPLAEARNHAPHGCEENQPDANLCRDTWGRGYGGYYNLTKTVELALFNGVNPLNGKQVGPQTGDPCSFTSFEDLLDSVRKQDEYFAQHVAIENGVLDKVHAEYRPIPFVAMLLPTCVQRGKDPSAGGAYYNWTGVLGVGPANAGDSLVTIKKLVYDEKKVTMAQLLAALSKNWVDHEELRQMCINVPKYGNDDDYVDSIVRQRMELWYDAIEKYKCARGGRFHPAVVPVTGYIPMGWLIGATPDGRRSGEMLCDSTAPSVGVDRKGPTATLKSVAKLDHVRMTGGVILNQKFHPSAVTHLQKWADLIRTYFDLGGMQIQMNIVSRETLIDAQKHPEKYRDLIIRASGFSVYFVELCKELQDSIIARTEHGSFY